MFKKTGNFLKKWKLPHFFTGKHLYIQNSVCLKANVSLSFKKALFKLSKSF